MFKRFLKYFGMDDKLHYTKDPYMDFMVQLGGCRFGNGLFTAFSADNIDKWMQIVTDVFPKFRGQFKLFGHNWMGDCFAVDLRKKTYGKVLMFEIGTGYVLEVPCSFKDFLNKELPNHPEDCLGEPGFVEWMNYSKKEIADGNCVGYRVPLFLDGEDEIENLEESDMEVYWEVIGQVMKQVGL